MELLACSTRPPPFRAYLEQTGYRNALFGKYFYGHPIGRDPLRFHDCAITTKKSYAGEEWNVQGRVRPVLAYSTDYIARKAVAFLERSEANDDRPWFMVLAPQAPHDPSPRPCGTRTRPFRGARRKSPAMRERDRSDKPPYVRGRAAAQSRHPRVRKKQLRTLMAVDEADPACFRLAAKTVRERRHAGLLSLRQRAHVGDHGLARKRHAYTDSIRIPMFARWPGTISARAHDDRLAGVLDVAPTILDAAGLVRTTSPMDGRSLLDGSKRRRMLLEYWSESRVPSWASTRTKRYQYVEYYGRAGRVTFREYHDLERDPSQLRNLLRDGDPTNDPDTRRLHERLTADRACTGPGCP